jgi:DinB superfamily
MITRVFFVSFEDFMSFRLACSLVTKRSCTMRALTGLTAVLATLLAAPAAAQTGDSISQAIRQAWDDAKGNLRQSAELIPEADLGFKPTEQVRTFGQILAHVAGANYVFCSAAKAEKSPFSEEHFEKTAKSKAEIVKAVNDSIAYCDAAYKALTDKSAAESIAMPFGMGNRPRVGALVGNTGHVQEHYGNLVTYFRIKGMVPPSSRR